MKDQKLNFLFISADRYPPFRPDIDTLFGVELLQRGHQIEWILQSEQPAESGYKTQWRDSVVWVGRNLPGGSITRRILRHIDKIRNSFKIGSLSKQNHYDFIQVKDLCLSALIALVVAKVRGIRYIYWMSYPFPDSSLYRAATGVARYPLLYYIRGKALSFLLYRVVMRLADHVMVQSEQMKQDIMKHGVSASSMTAVPMGVPSDLFEKTEHLVTGSANITPDRVVYLGTLARVRKMDFLIRAFAEVKKVRPNAELYLVGAGSDPKDEELLKDEATKLGVLDSVIFTGFLPMTKAWEIVATASVCVSPFYPTPILNSTSPTKLIEYMALAKPVVANDHPEQRLVIEESGAGLCVGYDEKAFGEAIAELLQNPERCREMGQKGRIYAKQHRSYPVIAHNVEETYRRVCYGT